jgi:hypothetical protein
MTTAGKGSESKRLITGAVALGMVLLVAWALVLSQSERQNQGASAYEQARIDSLRVTLGRDLPETSGRQSLSPTNNLWLVFVFMSGALGGVWWFFGRKASGKPASQVPFPVMAEQDLGGGHRLLLLDAGQEWWVLSLSAHTSQLIVRSSKSEMPWLGEISEKAAPAPVFSTLLRQLTRDQAPR